MQRLDSNESNEGGAHAVAEAVAERSYGRLLGLLATRTRDVAGAEDALSSALAAALVDWPAHGVPRNPEAWVLAVAKRRCIDAARRRRSAERAAGHLRLLAEELHAATERPDEGCVLSLVCAHPAIEPGVRAPLVLQALCGFDAAAIGSALRASPAAMSQRLVRAKKRIRDAGRRFDAAPAAVLAAQREALRADVRAALSQLARAPGRRRTPPHRRSRLLGPRTLR
ncbi:MAG TPA: sigma factor [Myxococcota bacterium]|nr:sigma factor [Myxococcota bacterium]